MPAALIIGAVEFSLAALAWAFTGFSARRACLLLIAATAPLELYRAPVLGYNLSLFRLSVGLGLALCIVEYRHGLQRGLKHPLVYGYAVLTLLMTASLLTLSDNTFLGQRVVAQAVIGTVSIFVLVVLGRGESVTTLATYLVSGAALPFLAASFQALAPHLGVRPVLPLLDHLPVIPGLERARVEEAFVGSQGARLRGSFGDPNHFGVYSLLVLSASVGLTLAARRRPRPEQLAVGGLGVASGFLLLASYSRTAWAAGVVAAFLFLILVSPPLSSLRNALTPRLIGSIALCAALVAVAVAPLAPRLSERLDPAATENEASTASHGRTVRIAWETALAHPATGVGLGDLGSELGQPRLVSGAHSSYLAAAAELGVPGVAGLVFLGGLLLAMLIGAARSVGYPERDRAAFCGLAAGYAGFLVANLSYDLWWDDFHWVIIGFGAAAAASARRIHRDAESGPVRVGAS